MVHSEAVEQKTGQNPTATDVVRTTNAAGACTNQACSPKKLIFSIISRGSLPSPPCWSDGSLIPIPLIKVKVQK